jgi:hypothetical protein
MVTDAVQIMREVAFLSANRRVHCPACTKRVSLRNDSLDLRADGPILFVCPHCAHRFKVERST